MRRRYCTINFNTTVHMYEGNTQEEDFNVTFLSPKPPLILLLKVEASRLNFLTS